MKKLGKYKKLAIASLSAIALAASIAVAQSVKTDQDKGQRSRPEWQGGRGERGDHAWGGMRGGLFSKLNLTDDQKAKDQTDSRELCRTQQTTARTASRQAAGVAS